MEYTRSQIRENREKWIDFLMVEDRRKARCALDKGKGKRCCLGHGCYILGVPKVWENGMYAYDGESGLPPPSFVVMVGLWKPDGTTFSGKPIQIGKWEFSDLADANDTSDRLDEKGNSVDVDIRPYWVGVYLLSVIEGGKDTSFKPLTDYPE